MLVTITPAGSQVLALAYEAERESEHLMGAVDDYEQFRQQLVKLIKTV